MKRGTAIISIFTLIFCTIILNSFGNKNTEPIEEEIVYKTTDTTFLSQFVKDSIKLDISFLNK